MQKNFYLVLIIMLLSIQATARPLADRLYWSADALWYYEVTQSPTALPDGSTAIGPAWFGANSHLPRVADIDGDGISDRVVCFDGGGFTHWVLDLSDGKGITANGWNSGVLGDATNNSESGFGGPPDIDTIPLLGDVNGDGKADRVIFDAGTWFVDFSVGSGFGDSNPDIAATYGGVDDRKPGLGDFNGDGLVDRVLYRDAGDGTGLFLIDYTPDPLHWGDGVPDQYILFGTYSVHSPAFLQDDFNGDGLADPLVTAPITGCCLGWSVLYSPGYNTPPVESTLGGETGLGFAGHFGGPEGGTEPTPTPTTPPSSTVESWNLY